jgi:hypothetical protein
MGLLFTNVFLATSFLSLHGYKRDSGGILAAASGTYALMAMRQKLVGRDRWGPRGWLRGITVGMCLVNVAAGGLAYALGKDTIAEEVETTED